MNKRTPQQVFNISVLLTSNVFVLCISGYVKKALTDQICGITKPSERTYASMPPPSANKAAHSGFETRGRCHQTPEIGGISAPQKDQCPPEFFQKKNLQCYKTAFSSTFSPIAQPTCRIVVRKR